VLAIGCGWQYWRDPKSFSFWQVNSRECLQTPLQLLRVMMVGPRWNTAAVCGSAGPFRVERKLRLQIAPTSRSAAFWSMMIFRPSNLARAQYVSSLSVPPDQEQLELELAPGDYFINMRCYRCADPVVFPRIEIDGGGVIDPVRVSPDVNEFHAQLPRFGTTFYRALNYHVWALVKWHKQLPERWVRKQLLPVGDPGTRFEFGLLAAGESLAFTIEPGVLEDYGVYLTAYDRASFPVQWYEASQSHFTGPPCPVDCIYLVRVVRLRASTRPPLAQDAIQLRTLPARRGRS
jgi:hypothetical protein